jgi:hypothetical protein
MICVQVESVKRQKMKRSGGGKRRLPAASGGKENLDPKTIPARKKKKTAKKSHNLSMHIEKNQPNQPN